MVDLHTLRAALARTQQDSRRAAHLVPVEELRIEDTRLGPGTGEALAGWWGLRAVAALRLGGNDLVAEDVVALAGSRQLDLLRTLDLSGNPLGDDGVAAVSCGPWRRLTALDIAGTSVGPRGLRALLEGVLPRLQLRLDVDACRGDAALMRELERRHRVGWCASR